MFGGIEADELERVYKGRAAAATPGRRRRRNFVQIVGEPGIGKSRLIEEFHVRLGETHMLGANCAGGVKRSSNEKPLYVCSWVIGSPRDGRPNRSPVG